MVAPPELGYDEGLKEYSTQDMERAKQLLEEAGAVGETVSVIHQNILFWPKVGQVVNSNLEELGLTVETQFLDSGTFSERQFDPEGHEVASWQRSAFVPDPDNKLSPLLAGDSSVASSITQNQLLPTQDELDSRLVEARQETDQEKRRQMYVDLQRFLAEDIMVYSMLAYMYTPSATTSNVSNFNADSLGTYRLFLEDTGFSGS
jgi:ABC-type transport system substrate-binding protein